MVDQPTPNEGADRSLEELLAEASTLAAELSQELGGLDADLALEEFHTSDALADSESELDAELANLAAMQGSSPDAGASETDPAGVDMSLLDAFGDDDPAPRSASEDTNQQTNPDAPGSAESNDDDVPDFMKEFTEDDSTTAEPATSTNSSVGGQSPIGERPGTVSTGMLGVVESATEPVAAEPTPPREPGRVAALARGALDTLRTRASPIGLRVGNHGVRLLEIMDRPFGRIGEPIRRIVGWVAIATCGTSTIAYLISLF